MTRLIADLTPVVSVIADERDALLQTVRQLVAVTERLPTAVQKGNIVAYAWIDDLNFGGVGLQTTDLTTSLRDLLLGLNP